MQTERSYSERDAKSVRYQQFHCTEFQLPAAPQVHHYQSVRTVSSAAVRSPLDPNPAATLAAPAAVLHAVISPTQNLSPLGSRYAAARPTPGYAKEPMEAPDREVELCSWEFSMVAAGKARCLADLMVMPFVMVSLGPHL